MRWRESRRSSNLEDRRGQRMKAGAGIGGGAILLLVLFVMLTGEDPSRLVEVLNQPGSNDSTPPSSSQPRPDDQEADFVSVVLASTEDTWSRLFATSGQHYQPPFLVLFDGAVRSACGLNSAAVGPFYCPGDQKVYLDLSFFRDLSRRFAAPGDFARAYVVAHEVGHHVQNLLGISRHVHQRMSQADQRESNALSVRMELQADCLAGVWGFHARQLLEEGDVEEGLTAAAAIGDDRLQKQSQGYVSPESWTHGSSDQRVRWLRRGLAEGRPEACDTFQSDSL